MAASNMKIELSVKDIDFFKNLVELLEKHFDDLPGELQDSLKQTSEGGLNDFVATDFVNQTQNFNPDLVQTNFKTTQIFSINKTLKKVEYFDKEANSRKVGFPESFYLKYDGKTIIEW